MKNTSKKQKTKTLNIADGLSEVECAERTKHWQTCKVSKLGDLFYAYDTSKDDTVFSQMSQRVLAYSLDTTDAKEMFKKYKAGESYIQIFMGCGGNDDDHIPDYPQFRPFIQLFSDSTTKPVGFQNCYDLSWNKIPPFYIPETNLSAYHIEIKVSKDAADLFVTAWCKQEYKNLASLFEASIYDTYVARVKSYIFGPSDVDLIYAAIGGANPSSRLFMLLGVELTSEMYPFGFRPVIQIGEWTTVNPNMKKKSKKKKKKNTEVIDPVTLPTYYEFSTPCPPFCKENQ